MQMPALIPDLLFKDWSRKEVPRTREVLLLPCSRTASHAVGLSLAGRHFQSCVTSPGDILCHVAQDGMAFYAKENTGLSKSKDSVFCTARLLEHSLQYFTATNFACQAWKPIRKHLLSRANYSVIIFGLLCHSQTLPGSCELAMINEHQNIQVLCKLLQYSKH